MLELIEAEGAHGTADDYVAGKRLSAQLVDEETSPMEALTAHYQLPRHRRTAASSPPRARPASPATSVPSRRATTRRDGTIRREAGSPSLLLAGQNQFAPDRAAQARAVLDFLSGLRGAAA